MRRCNQTVDLAKVIAAGFGATLSIALSTCHDATRFAPFVCGASAQGVDLRHLQELMGHASVSMRNSIHVRR